MVDEKLAVVNIVIANEIHNLRSVFRIASSSFSLLLISPKGRTFHISNPKSAIVQMPGSRLENSALLQRRTTSKRWTPHKMRP
jgi:hypothetical protein